MELNSDFRNLINDYKSSDNPQWYDPKTVNTLKCVVDSILKEEYSKIDFEDFAEKELGKGDFCKACKNFVRCVLMYFEK